MNMTVGSLAGQLSWGQSSEINEAKAKGPQKEQFLQRLLEAGASAHGLL